VWERGEEQPEAKGSSTTIVGFITDITDRKRAEEEVLMLNLTLEKRVSERTAELADANDQLKELDRLKSEFLATMSHELRTPLNSIIGFSTLLSHHLAGPLNPEQQKQIELVNGSARHLLILINDLLDLSRIESGKVELTIEDFALNDVLKEVEQVLSPAVHQKKLIYRTEIVPSHLQIRSDRKRVYQIVLNLANNAVKFTDRGEVSVVCTSEPDSIRIAVTDTGIGIKPEQLPMLFEAFRQVDGSARRVYEGTGLGLHLCRKLLSLLNGQVEVRSTFGQGSCFTVWLPLAFAGSPGSS
jgi:signal transduction histidine kinase